MDEQSKAPELAASAAPGKWCSYCRKNDHDDSECWSTRPADWQIEGYHAYNPGLWLPPNAAPQVTKVDPELLVYWRTFPAPSNEVLAVDLIEGLQRELAEAYEARARDVAAVQRAFHNAIGATCATCGFRYWEYQGHIIPCPLCYPANVTRKSLIPAQSQQHCTSASGSRPASCSRSAS